MNTNPHDNTPTFQEIQQYLQGKLSAEQQHQFEKKMMRNSFWNDAVEGWSILEASEKREQWMQAVESSWQQVHTHPSTGKRIILWQNIGSIAAAVTLLVMVSFWVIWDSPASLSDSSLAFESISEQQEERMFTIEDTTAPTLLREPLSSEASKEDALTVERLPEEKEVEATRSIAKQPPPRFKEEKVSSSTPNGFPITQEKQTVPSEIPTKAAAEEQTIASVTFQNDSTETNTPAATLARTAKATRDEARPNSETDVSVQEALEEDASDDIAMRLNASPNAVNQHKSYAPNPYQLYSLERYAEAIPLLEDYQRRAPKNSTLLYLLSVCYLETERPKQAIAMLSKLKKKAFPAFEPKSVINLIEKGKTQEALVVLRQYTLVNKELILKE